MPQKIRPAPGSASQIMWESGNGGGGPYVHCQCGTEFSLTEEEYEAAEYDGITYINLDSKVFVTECPGCAKALARYETFIWESRDTIRRYLQVRVDQEKMWADQEKLLNTMAGIK